MGPPVKAVESILHRTDTILVFRATEKGIAITTFRKD